MAIILNESRIFVLHILIVITKNVKIKTYVQLMRIQINYINFEGEFFLHIPYVQMHYVSLQMPPCVLPRSISCMMPLGMKRLVIRSLVNNNI